MMFAVLLSAVLAVEDEGIDKMAAVSRSPNSENSVKHTWTNQQL